MNSGLFVAVVGIVWPILVYLFNVLCICIICFSLTPFIECPASNNRPSCCNMYIVNLSLVSDVQVKKELSTPQEPAKPLNLTRVCINWFKIRYGDIYSVTIRGSIILTTKTCAMFNCINRDQLYALILCCKLICSNFSSAECYFPRVKNLTSSQLMFVYFQINTRIRTNLDQKRCLLAALKAGVTQDGMLLYQTISKT